MLDRFCDDTGLLFSILQTGKVYHLPGVAFVYRQRMASIMDTAVMMELSILELGIMQDAVNHGGFEKSTLTRFVKPLRYVWDHRDALKEEKYKKYRMNYAMYSNDFLTLIEAYDHALELERNKLKKLISRGESHKFFFKIRRKIHKLVGVIIRGIK